MTTTTNPQRERVEDYVRSLGLICLLQVYWLERKRSRRTPMMNRVENRKRGTAGMKEEGEV